MFTTNEIGEIVLVESEVTEKKKKAKSKKEEKPSFLPPFFSEDFFNFLISNDSFIIEYREQIKNLIMNWNNEEYLPLYSLDINLGFPVPIIEYRNINSRFGFDQPWDESINNYRFTRNLKNHSEEEYKFFQKIWKEKNFFLLSLLDSNIFASSQASAKNIKEYFIKKTERLLVSKPPNLEIAISRIGHAVGIKRIIDKFKYDNSWKTGEIRSTNKTFQYVINFGFLGQHDSFEVPKLRKIVPLVCMVFKKENLELLRHYIVTNSPIPSELLELWVDKSIEDTENKNPIHNSYVRQIRNYYKKLGVELVVKDNLLTELYDVYSIKKFKSYNEELAFINDILEKFTEQKRKELGIS